jgi:heme exporter protein B
MSGFAPGVRAVLAREVRLALAGGGAVLPAGFFVGATWLVPLVVGPDADTLAGIGPGLLWLALALAGLLPMERLFQPDLEDGTLDPLLMSELPGEVLALTRILAHFVASGLPMLMMAPLLWLMLGLPLAGVPVALASFALGTLSFFALGAICAALSAGVRRGGLLIALLTFPLYAPVAIFGAAATFDAARGEPVGAAFVFLAALTLGALALAPLAIAGALRLAAE